MLLNNLIIAWRNLMRHRLHTVINLAGLGLGLAFCLLAWRFASQEWSFDRFHSKADRIYRVYYEVMDLEKPVREADVIDFAFAPKLEALSPYVERTVRLSAARANEQEHRVVRTTFEGSSSDEEFLLVDPVFFEVFDFPLLLGDAATALAERNSVVLSYEMAQRLFEDADPLGQRLTIASIWSRRTEDFTITGVAAPIPRTSSIQFNMLLPFDNTMFLFRKPPDAWEGTCNAYVLLKPAADPADLAPAFLQLTQQIIQMMQSEGKEIPKDRPEDFSPYQLQPLIDMRSDTGLTQWVGHGVMEPRDPYVSYVLVSMALAVLLMGCINFVQTMGLELIRGRDFSQAEGDKEDVVVIAESAASRLGFTGPIGETIEIVRMSSSGQRKSRELRIIGVVKDFTFESGHEERPPGLLMLELSLPGEGELMFVRVKPGDLQEVIQYMEETWNGIVDYADFNFSFLQQDLEAAYRDELRWRQLITWAAVGAVFISALGAFALTALAASRRTKEIGIRKALGASVLGLTTLMTREFACLALIGSAIAWPLSWWWMRDWLNGFAFRIDLAAWHFVAGAAIALVAVLISSGHQAYKAAKADPVEALRYE